MRKQDYPPNWKDISLSIRIKANWCCEKCGAPSNKVIQRGPASTFIIVEKVRKTDADEWESTTGMSWRRLNYFGLTRIILTVAHLDRDRTNNAPENLAALCQRCHLNHDRQAQHLPHRKYGRYHDREHQGKLKL